MFILQLCSLSILLFLGSALSFPQLISIMRRLETQDLCWTNSSPYFSLNVPFCPSSAKFLKQTQKAHAVYTNIAHVQTERQTDRHKHMHSNKAPFRMRAYTDIKGPLFSPSYRYSTGGLCCEHIYASATVCLCEAKTYGVNSGRHPRHPLLPVTWDFVCVCVFWGLFFLWEQLRGNSSSNNTGNGNNCAFDGVCLWWCVETGNEITLRALGVRAEGLWESRAGPGGEYQSLIRRRRWVYGNEQIIRGEVGSVVTPGTAVSCFLSLPMFSLLRFDSHPEC